MVKIQLDIPEDLNKKLKIYAIEKDMPTKADAINDILYRKLK